MKFKRVLSGVLAGIIAVTSTTLPAFADAEVDESWDLPILLASDYSSQNVITELAVAGWEPFTVDLTSFGIMTESTEVTITCTTTEQNIVDEDGETPEAAFGVVIRNNWNKDEMPRSLYDGSKTEFTLTLTYDQMNYQPVFTVQSQLPCEAVFSVTATGLGADERATADFDPQTENYTMHAHEDSGWLIGAIVDESFARVLSGVTLNTTTVADLLGMYKSISCSGNPYYGDSAGAGVSAFNYGIYVDAKNTATEEEIRFSSPTVGYTEEATFYLDAFCDYINYIRNPAYADYVITGTGIAVGTNLDYDFNTGKSYAANDAIKNLPDGTPVTIEAVNDTRSTATLPAVGVKSMTLTAEDGEGWLLGSYVWAAYVVPAPEGITYNETTVGELREAFKSFTTTANTYKSDSLDAGKDNFVYAIDLNAVKDEVNIRFGNDSFDLTSAGTVYVDNFDNDGTKITAGTYDDYVVDAIIIKVQSKLGWNDDVKKCYALCEDIYNMTPGDTMTLEFAEDTRTALALDAVSDYMVTLNTYGDGTFGTMVGGSVNYTNSELIGKTVSELFDTYKAVTVTAPGYFDDSVKAGAEAFVYAPTIRVADANETDPRWLDWDKFALTEDGRMNLDQYTTWLEDCGDYTVKEVYIYFQAKTGETQIVNETLRGLKEGTDVVLELREDTRAAVNAPTLPKSISLNVYRDDYNIGSAAEADVEITALFDAATIGELFSKYKGVTVPAGAYYSDTLGLGAAGFEFNLLFNGKDGEDNYHYGNCNGKLAYNEGGFFSFDDINYDGADTDTLNYIALNIRPITEWVEAEQKNQAVSEAVRNLEPGSEFILETAQDTRAAVEVTAPTDPVRINIWTHEEGDWMVGSDFGAVTAALDVTGIEYNTTTIGDLCESTKSISTTLPYYLDTIGAGKDAFEYKFVFVFDFENPENAEDNERWIFCRTTAPVGEKLTQRTDEIAQMVSEEIGEDDYVIKRVYLNIEPKREDVNNDKQQAASAVIRGLADGTVFVYEPVKDTRTDAAVSVDYPLAVDLEVFAEEEWTSGAIAFVQLTGEVDGLTGITVSEMLETYRSFSVTAPSYFDDSLDLGSEFYDYQFGIRISDGNNDDYIFTEKLPLNKDTILYTTANWYDGLEDYTISEIFVKIMAATEQLEDGRDQTKAEVIRTMQPGDTITVELREDTRAEIKLPAVTGSMDVYVWEDNAWLIGSSCSGDSDALTVSGITYGETTLGDILDGYKEISGEVLPYLSDSLNIGKDAFKYTFGFYLENDEFVRFDKWADFNEALTVNVDTLSFTEEQKALKINAITYHVEPKYEPADEMQRAVNETVRGLEPDSSFVITLTATKPQNVKAVAGDGKVALTWDKVEGATEYVVYFGTGTSLKVYCTTTALGKTVSGLANGTKYTFLVRAKVNGAWSKFTTADFVYATPVAPVVKPTVKAVAGDGRVALTWDKIPNATEYVVYVGTGASLKVYCTTTALGKTVSGLANGTKYTFLVRAKVDGAWTKFTSEDFVYATPEAPVVLKPTVKAVAGDGRVALTWDKVTGATEYVVYVGTGTSLKVYCTTTALGKTVSGLANGTKYTFLVRARVDGAWTKFTTADFVYATPEAPAVLKPTVKAVAGDGRVALTWDKVTGATEYVVYVGTGTSLKVYCTTTALGKTVSGLKNGTKYTFLVRAKVDGVWTKFTAADYVYATPSAS